MNKHEIKRNAARTYAVVKTIIDAWDPVGLLSICPDDEYDSESMEIARLALMPAGDVELGERIRAHFGTMFGTDIFQSDLSECIVIAREIRETLNEKPKRFLEQPSVVIKADQITEMNRSGLLYKNDAGIECRIDFVECRQNWADYIAKKFSGTTAAARANTKCVATKDVTSFFFEFYCEPKVRVQIDPKRNFMDRLLPIQNRRRCKIFREIQNKIIEMGWTTFDMS